MLIRGVVKLQKRRPYLVVSLIIVFLVIFGLFTNSVAAPTQNIQLPSTSISLIPVIYPSAVKGSLSGNPSLDKNSMMPLPPAHQGLANSSSPELRKLAEYEQAAGGSVVGGMLLFTDVPASQAEAHQHAAELAAAMKEFARFQITPVVIFEPTTDEGELDLQGYNSGHYDSFIETLFTDLKKSDLDDHEIGTWVIFSEFNAPLWGNTDPEVFAAAVTRTAQIQKRIFPNSQSSILLNSQTYNSADVNWENGIYSSLVPYVRNIPRGLIDSFGLQGFPWVPAAGDNGQTVFDAAQFLPLHLAEEAAAQLGVEQVWFNTGTFGRNYTNNPNRLINISYDQRQKILDRIASQAAQLSGDGYQVTVDLFSQDKSKLDEATDWSYWHNDDFVSNNKGKAVFKDFALQLYDSNIGIWIFDTY